MTVGQSSVFTSDYRKAKISAANIFRLLDRRSREAEVTGSEIRDFQGNVAFAAVHFHYPGRPEARVLRGLSLEVKSGQKVALVGASGCGKSTSVQLLERFYDVTRGAIHVDGRDVTSVDRHWLRRQMALVSQEPTLFSGTIRENIAYGARDVTFDAIVRSAQMANVHDFVQSLPSQYETRVGARGAQLSGGQKQRIAIARALIRDPRILLLDEATSALDTASEECVQMALEEAAKGRTCLVIAHRMSTVRSADVICVLERGAVVESGSHEQLMQRKGVYFRLNSL
ncbi:unnamed protein product [Medioppia subpectinata]|uniref:ABC-type xenobiotic transporter n=1 Tax=Medioppia subpectinata TaxID=1979941 RepID=A0A7R9KFR5_9ACAR|nr:unnamed protein product [Medioppia subpectinata]CAG2102554.1 unnamed protein product [Medioppia subpectinata]